MDETSKTFHRVLSIAGISFFAKDNWNSKLWLLLQILNFTVGVFCFIFTTAFVIVNHSDFILFIEGVCIWITGIIMTITLGLFLFFRYDFRNFLQEMVFKDNMFEMPFIRHVILPQNTPKLIELQELVLNSQEKLSKYTRILLKSYVTSVTFCVTLYLCSPISEMITTEDESARIIGFEMWFPWSLQNMNVYVLTFIFNIYSAYLCSIAYPGLQILIILLLGQVIRQLKILSFILLHLNDLVLELNSSQDERWQDYSSLLLRQCVDHYVMLKRFSNQMNLICRPFYLALILVATMLVCVCSVKIATSNKFTVDTMKYYVHESSIILVMLSFCLMGQQVQNECETLDIVVTEKWFIYNKSHKTNVRIFSMALSQRMPIYVFGTITLSLPTFTWFIKTGMSFFTLAMSVLEEDQN